METRSLEEVKRVRPKLRPGNPERGTCSLQAGLNRIEMRFEERNDEEDTTEYLRHALTQAAVDFLDFPFRSNYNICAEPHSLGCCR